MIKWIVITLIGLIILGYLGFDVKKVIDSPMVQTNLTYAKNATVYVWHGFLEKPATYVWDKVFIKYIWDPFIDYLDKKIKGSEKETSARGTGAFSLS